MPQRPTKLRPQSTRGTLRFRPGHPKNRKRSPAGARVGDSGWPAAKRSVPRSSAPPTTGVRRLSPIRSNLSFLGRNLRQPLGKVEPLGRRGKAQRAAVDAPDTDQPLAQPTRGTLRFCPGHPENLFTANLKLLSCCVRGTKTEPRPPRAFIFAHQLASARK